MLIRLNSLKLHNFKAHRDLEVKFGDLTKITADNAMGKSSILEAITWILYGTDVLGSKTDPTPTNYEYDHVKADLLLSVDEKQLLLGRGIEKGKTTYYINEVPSKATEFDELLKSIFDKDVFLSLLNPSYFPSLHWEKQRELILRYVSAPANKEVFKHLPATQADKLSKLLKKYSIEDLQKIHSKNKTDKDKSYIAAQSRTKTLQEQFDKIPITNISTEETESAIANVNAELAEVEKAITSAEETNRKRAIIETKIEGLNRDIKNSKERYPELRDEEILETCRTCGQALQEEAVEVVKADKARRIKDYQDKHTAMVNERKALEEELSLIEFVDATELRNTERDLIARRYDLKEALEREPQRLEFQQKVEQAKSLEAETLQSRNDSIFVLDAIKAFLAKEAELQASKVQELFTTLSLRLFKVNKTDGEIKPDFEIMMDDKPYSKLSLSESIRAGLELRDVLSQQSEIVAPCFVDNAESITRFKQPNGQLIVSRVVAGQELKIETEASSNEK